MESADTRNDNKKNKCMCPYCESECEDIPVVCSICQITLVECVSCGSPVREGADICPSCGNSPVSPE